MKKHRMIPMYFLLFAVLLFACLCSGCGGPHFSVAGDPPTGSPESLNTDPVAGHGSGSGTDFSREATPDAAFSADESPRTISSNSEIRTVLRCAIRYGDDSVEYELLQWLGDAVSDATGGRISLDILSAGVLGSEAEALRMVADGRLDLCVADTSVLSELVPDFTLLSAPFLFDSEEHLERVLESDALDSLLISAENAGFSVLCLWSPGPLGLCTRDIPITELSELSGLTIRPGNTPSSTAFWKLTGCLCSDLPSREVWSSLYQGTLDGLEDDIITYTEDLHCEVAPYYTVLNHLFRTEALVIGSRTLSSLSAEECSALRELCSASVPYSFERFSEKRETCRRVADSLGAVFLEPDWEAFRSLSEELTLRLIGDSNIAQTVFRGIQALRD